MQIHRKTKVLYTLLLIIIMLFSLCSCTHKNPTLKILSVSEKYSIKEMYNLAEDYVTTYIGDNYELFKLSMTLDKSTGEDKAEFIYTKRTKMFRDVCFVRFNISEGEISSSMQSEAQRLYGRDIIVDVPNWTVDTSELLQTTDFSWTRAEIETSFNYNVVKTVRITFYKDDYKFYICELNPVTKEVIGEIFG